MVGVRIIFFSLGCVPTGELSFIKLVVTNPKIGSSEAVYGKPVLRLRTS